mgnify:FL=1
MADTVTNDPLIRFSDVTGEMTHSASVSFPMPDFSKFALPLVNSSPYPSLTAQQIVNVQPMMAPASQIFYFEHESNSVVTIEKTDIWKDLETRLKDIKI